LGRDVVDDVVDDEDSCDEESDVDDEVVDDSPVVGNGWLVCDAVDVPGAWAPQPLSTSAHRAAVGAELTRWLRAFMPSPSGGSRGEERQDPSGRDGPWRRRHRRDI
jgi:hypothetical protein